MSGGAFDYDQYRIDSIADEIAKLITRNGKPDEWGDVYYYAPGILSKFQETRDVLIKASNMVHAIDWLVSGDTGEESFLEEWEGI